MTTIATLADLEALYGPANPNSLKKEVPQLTLEYRRWIEAAPFFAVATSGPGGLDCSPRGDTVGGLIQVFDERTVAFPDRRGNNRIDTLRNLIADPRIALLFLIPGIEEALRINGRATITTDAEILARFAVENKLPVTAVVVKIESVYFQCARALLRSRLWDPAARTDRSKVPTAGAMLKATDNSFAAEAYDTEGAKRLAGSLY